MTKGRFVSGGVFVGLDGEFVSWEEREPDIEMDLWEVQVFGEAGSSSFEISLVRRSNTHGKRSYGWFDEKKLLITHNGGPCSWPLIPLVWNKQIQIANELAATMNNNEFNVIGVSHD